MTWSEYKAYVKTVDVQAASDIEDAEHQAMLVATDEADAADDRLAQDQQVAQAKQHHLVVAY